MIKATTSHGTYYLIDLDNNKAMRVKGEGRNGMHGDSEWFSFFSVSAYDFKTMEKSENLSIGKGLFFLLTGHNHYDWRSSTPVISIEEVDVR